MKFPFIDVQYVYNKECNLAKITNYCIFPNSRKRRASLHDIFRALKVFKKHNFQVKILGGNPSDDVDFELFIKEMNRLDIDYAITDNAINYQKLIDCKVKGVLFSLDTLGTSHIGGCSYVKSMKTKEIIPSIKDSFEYLGANIIINSLNIREIPNIIEFLTENNAVANLCPMIIGKNDNFVYRANDNPYSLEKMDNYYGELQKLCGKLIEMKNSGYKIGVPRKYLELLPDVIRNNGYEWNCHYIMDIPILRVNTDLSLMICSDLIGEDMSKYSIFDIEDKFEEINESWVNDSQKRRCCMNNGCYWSNIVISDIYVRKGFGTLDATRRNL